MHSVITSGTKKKMDGICVGFACFMGLRRQDAYKSGRGQYLPAPAFAVRYPYSTLLKKPQPVSILHRP